MLGVLTKHLWECAMRLFFNLIERLLKLKECKSVIILEVVKLLLNNVYAIYQ